MLRPLLFAFLWAGLISGLSAQFVSTTNTGLGQLECLAVDPQGNRYVSDRSGNRVWKIDANNTPTVYCGSGLSLPTGLVRVPSGEIYVASSNSGTVAVIPPGGGPASVYASGFSFPRGLAADADGNLYVGQYFDQRIYKVAPGGAVSQVVGNAGITGTLGANDRLEHLAIEPTGNLIATIGFGTPGRVYRIALPSGTPTLLASSPLLTGAFAINVNQSTGNIYITGIYGHRIFSLTPQGALSVLTGDGTNATLDGPLDLARFSEPSGITIDPNGNIWISQYGGAIRRIGLQPAEVPTNGLRLWLRSDLGLLRNGSTVSQWLDQSGSGNHATPSFGTPPVVVNNEINALPVVRFNGVNNGLSTPAFVSFPNKRGTVFAVARVNGPSSTSGQGLGHICGPWYNSPGTTWRFGATTSNYVYFDGVGTVDFSVPQLPPNAWGIVTLHRNADTSFDFYKSGILAATSAVANNQPASLPQRIGYSGFPGMAEVLNGDIAEIIYYDRALTAEELEQVNTYLADKYFLNGDVPLPTAQAADVCISGTATLTASGGNAYRWYDSPTATVPLATTASFTTPVIASATTYYVANFNGQLQSQRVPVTVNVLQPGAACDDGDPNTIDDVYQADCTCAGTPVVACENVTLEFVTGASPADLNWQFIDVSNASVVASGTGLQLPADALVQVPYCLAQNSCFLLSVTDAGDGADGYQLRYTATQARIIDNTDNLGTGTSEITGNAYSFCLPMGTNAPIYTSCDKEFWRTGEYLVADEDVDVSAIWIPNGPNSVQSANTGYEFWFFNPNGGYSFRRFRSHNQSDGFGNVGATRACHMKVNNWAVAQHIPEFDLHNVRIRARLNGVNKAWGPACRFVRNEALAQCPPTKLMDIPGNPFLSCDQFRQFVSTQRVHARPVSGANRYEWRFRIPAENVEIVRTSTSYFLNLGWGPLVAAPLQNGKTYEVDVRASRDGGATWCGLPGDPWGDVCLLTIGTPPAQDNSQNLALSGNELFNLWPNPNTGDELWISLSEVAQGVETIAVDIHDLFGKRVSAQMLATQGDHVYTVMQLPAGLASGVYTVSILAGEQRFTQRLVIAR